MKMMMREKGVHENETRNSEPILPTPPAHQRLIPDNDQSMKTQNKKGKANIPNPPKMELPM